MTTQTFQAAGSVPGSSIAGELKRDIKDRRLTILCTGTLVPGASAGDLATVRFELDLNHIPPSVWIMAEGMVKMLPLQQLAKKA